MLIDMVEKGAARGMLSNSRDSKISVQKIPNHRKLSDICVNICFLTQIVACQALS
jgi:hypothetical protein